MYITKSTYWTNTVEQNTEAGSFGQIVATTLIIPYMISNAATIKRETNFVRIIVPPCNNLTIIYNFIIIMTDFLQKRF